MFERFTDEAKLAAHEARHAAVAGRAAAADDVHLLIGCCSVENGRALACLARCGVEGEVLVARSWALCEARPPNEAESRSRTVTFTPAAKRVLQLAREAADELRHREIGSDHLLLGVLRADGEATELLRNLGITDEDLCSATLAERSARLDSEAAAALEPMTRVLRDALEVCTAAGEQALAAELRALIESLEKPK
ncbi:MAG: hypothetical protein IT453_14625 [Planctomycetes bacterium]|nr:hypothetical protein [Planctomycetota bacterium]